MYVCARIASVANFHQACHRLRPRWSEKSGARRPHLDTASRPPISTHIFVTVSACQVNPNPACFEDVGGTGHRPGVYAATELWGNLAAGKCLLWDSVGVGTAMVSISWRCVEGGRWYPLVVVCLGGIRRY